MSESDGEQAARSLALEQAYVHEVYEQCADRTVQGKHWPRIYQFLEELEPGALVCDIGCGNGKYLNVNHNVFKIGVDRCTKFTRIAREKENEVLTCDNLSLPFRDESFDAVLSIAVVHHFSTTERRVRAIKELARVLRIGGRLVISVWAMEQKHRKFESQDVLVPWPKAYCVSSTGSPMKVRGMSCDERHRGKSAQTYLLSKSRGSSSVGGGGGGCGSGSGGNGNGGGGGNGQRKGSKNKSYWIDPIFSPSPSTSSLSSPNETCYSFFRRALQKLAGGRRSSRAWFLENWQNAGKERRSYEDEDDGDVDDLPIELRRLEEHSSLNRGLDAKPRPQLLQQHSDSLSVKSKSLSSIVEAQRQDLVRSRSSIPGLCAAAEEQQQQHQLQSQLQPQLQQSSKPTVQQLQQQLPQRRESSSPGPPKPRLVKQKTHFTDEDEDDDEHEHEDDEEEDEDGPDQSTAIPCILEDLPEFQQQQQQQHQQHQLTVPSSYRRNVHKQSSMNEELMSIERLKERESVRKNIMKQASLNEELIYKSRTGFEAVKDTLYSGGARFQLLKSGLTNRIKQSTTNIEKVSGISIKNGFVRILQSWKSTEGPSSSTTSTTTTSSDQSKCPAPQSSPAKREGPECIERRLSREDGSDSSKDSSLQSDTSVDSEDSFASVIYVPKKNSSPLIDAAAAAAASLSVSQLQQQQQSLSGYQQQQLNTASAPPSPRVKYAPELSASGQRLKLVSVSPLLKQQFPATSKSLPPPSPPGLSPRTLNSANMRPFFSGNEGSPNPASSSSSPATLRERIAEVKRSFDVQPLPRIPPTRPPPMATTVTAPTPAPVAIVTTTVAGPISDAVPTVAATAAQEPRKSATNPPVRQLSQEDRAESKRTSVQSLRGYRSMSRSTETDEDPENSDDTSPLITDAIDEALEQLSEKPLDGCVERTTTTSSTTSATTISSEEEKSRLNQIRNMLSQSPGFATRSIGRFPLVRRASSVAGAARFESMTKVLPRLLSLELFNPETDDLDSDSSGVSSPESVGSVISVISDERFVSKRDSGKSEENGSSAGSSSKDLGSGGSAKLHESGSEEEAAIERNPSASDSDSLLDASSSGSSGRPAGTETTSTRPVTLDPRISPVESTWNEECKRQLNDFTDRLSSENLIHDIDQFCRRTKLEFDDEASKNLTSTRAKFGNGKFESGPKQQQARQSRDNDYCDLDNNNKEQQQQRASEEDGNSNSSSSCGSSLLMQRSCSEESDAGSFVVVTKSGEFLSERELRQQQQKQQQQQQPKGKAPRIGQQRYNGNNSIESSDIGDSIENTISESSQAESPTTRRLCSSSTASLASSSLAADLGPRLRLSAQTRSASEEIPSSRGHLLHQQRQVATAAQQARGAAHLQPPRRSATSVSNGTLSGSSSQESLPSDQMTYHQYYHVFREGELDQLIEKYVENLHVISSYYDHASWCIVAEKVQVWTI